MKFGPLELQACGENNFTMKALGLLSFRPDLLRRFIREVLNLDAADHDDVSILFFTRIGEGFFREAIDRSKRDGVERQLERKLNAALGLPSTTRWSRNADGSLTQPAKWQAGHITAMMSRSDAIENTELEAKFKHLQNCFNTEPDLVLQWANNLALVEIKVLSGEGLDQLQRQRDLGEFVGDLLGWQSHFFMIGPDHGGRPSVSGCEFISWDSIASRFDDIPEIAEYIREFAFYYRGRWQSMVERDAQTPGGTAYDLFIARPGDSQPSVAARDSSAVAAIANPATVSGSSTASTVSPTTERYFNKLDRTYFEKIAHECRASGYWPIRRIWLGITGSGSRPNWMVEDMRNRTRTKHADLPKYDAGRISSPILWSEVVARYGSSYLAES